MYAMCTRDCVDCGLLAYLTTTVQLPFTAGAKTDTKSKQAVRVVNILPFVESIVLSL